MPDHFPPPYAYQDQIVEEEGELLLYRFHGWLSSLSADVKLRHLGKPRDLERALLYIEARDPARARLLHGALQMMGALLDEATDLVNDGIHWPTVEAFYCPCEDDFHDTPGQWLALGQAHGSVGNAPVVIETPAPAEVVTSGEAAPSEDAAAAPCPPAPIEKPTRRASASSLRSLGRSLRTECEFEKRRFYAIARKHDLPTDANAAPAIRKALSELLGEPIASRKQLTARQWSLAASSLETEDLHWDAPKAKPKAAPCP